jgi:putative flippase GtrA
MTLDSFRQLPFKKFIRFSIIGISALALDVGIYYYLTRFHHVPYLVSRAISLSIAIVWNFSLNRSWTFQATDGSVAKQAPKFLLVILCTSVLSLALLKFGVTVLHIHDLIVIFIVSFLIMVINFSSHLFWSYASEK